MVVDPITEDCQRKNLKATFNKFKTSTNGTVRAGAFNTSDDHGGFEIIIDAEQNTKNHSKQSYTFESIVTMPLLLSNISTKAFVRRVSHVEFVTS